MVAWTALAAASVPPFIAHTSSGETSPGERAACSFGRRKGADEFKKGPTNWSLFDREKAAHESGALTGAKERYDCVLRQLAFVRRRHLPSVGRPPWSHS